MTQTYTNEVSVLVDGIPVPSADVALVISRDPDGRPRPPVLTVGGVTVKGGVPVRLTVIYDGPAGDPSDAAQEDRTEPSRRSPAA